MSIELAEFMVTLFGLYLAAGVIFAVVFQSFGMARIDPAARGVGLGFRVLVLPGLIGLWPVMVVRWVGAGLWGDGE